jgi:hypothetical protein
VMRTVLVALVLACGTAIASTDPPSPAPATKAATAKKSPAKKSTTVKKKKATAKKQAKPKVAAKKAKPIKKKTAAPVKTAVQTDHKSTDEEPTDPARFDKVADPTASPAYRYGQLSRDDCEKELGRRRIGFTRESARPGVLAPVRLTGPLHGVEFHSDEAEKKRATSPYEIADCRLVLALDDFAAILASHDIVEVRHYSMYRPPDKSWPDDKQATRHPGALAIDAARFTAKDGSVLIVDKHWNGAIGDATCGDAAAPHPVTPEATALRAILCDAVAAHLFNVVLTPNYNKPHHNHFHLEVTAGVKWFLVH